MRQKPLTTEAQLQRELEALKIGYHQEPATTFIKPVNLMATGLHEPADIEEYIQRALEDNDLYNGYAITGRRQAMEYLNTWNGSQYNLDAALTYALDYGYDLQSIERMGCELLANIAAHEQAHQEDADHIAAASERIAFILKADLKREPEEADI